MALGRKPIEIVNEGKHQLLAKADHWGRIYLHKVAKVQNGYAFSSSNFSKSDGLPLIRIRDIDSDTTVDKYNGEFPKDYLVNKGDILIGMDGDFKAAKWKGEQALLNQRVCRIFPNSNDFDEKFLFLCLQPFLDAINAETSAVTVKHLSSRTIEEIPLPHPPLEEQQQIVSKVEELFSELDKSIEELKTGQQQLKVYRQAVLKWAFEGKLTNENVKDGELPEGWKWVKLGKACNKIQDGSHFSPQQQYHEAGEDRFMYITAKNIRNDYMDLSKLTYVDKDFHDSIYQRCNPEYGDVLLTKDGVNTGEVTLNTLHEPFSLLSSVCIFKTNRMALTSAFLKYFIQSPFGSKAIANSMTGTAIKRIILRKIKESEIVLPPLEEQQQIVQEIESRLSVCDKIEETINNSLKQAEALRQSILKKAFEGNLK
jgi:type I restriction enzyme, S subunit